MRGEVLSSVELVLPLAVVETCYNIKRDVQARFRAVNNEEKTKSEITVEKQADDSVKIHVIVVSLTCLTDEEICEEVAYGVPDKENTQRTVGRGRRRVRRKGRQGFTRKPKGSAKKKPVNIQPSEESIQTTITEGVSKEDKDVDYVAKPNEVIQEDSVIPKPANQISDVKEIEEEETPVVHISTKSSRGKGVRRGGRGRRGRSFGGRRGVGRRAAATEISVPSDSSYQPNSVSADNAPSELIETAPIELPELGQADVQAEKVPESYPSASVSDIPVESEETVLKAVNPKARGKRVRRNTDRSSQGEDPSASVSDIPVESEETVLKAINPKARGKRVRRNTDRSSQGEGEEGVSPAKVGRPKRKVIKQQEEGGEPAAESSTVGKDKSPVKEEEPLTLTKGKKGPKKKFTRKRKVIAPSILPDTDYSPKEETENEAKTLLPGSDNTTIVNNQSGEQELSKEEPDKDRLEHPCITQKAKPAKGRPKAKIIRITEVVSSTEESSKSQNDDVSVQSQAAAVVPSQNSDEGIENVTAVPVVPVVKRKGRKPKVKRGRPPQRRQQLPVEPPPIEIPIEPLRVKTKAQLKQKPSELANFSDNDTETFTNRTPDGSDYIYTDYHTPVSKQIVKKTVQKPKTLARIWRTRKKSGFTHKKKSKPKPGKDSTAIYNERQTGDDDIYQQVNDPPERQPELLPNNKSNDVNITDDRPQGDHVSDDLKEISCINEDAKETEKEKPMPELGQPELGQPELGQSELGQPELGQPELGQPGLGQPELGQPELVQPELRQPELRQPELVQPELGQRQLEEHKRLPQKKRHTAKLAAERQKAADEANASSETLVSEVSLQVPACNVTNTQSNSVTLDVSTLDLYSTCTDFNETSAIESLIQLSNATDESLNTYRGTVQYEEEQQLSIEQMPTLINGLTALEPPVLQPEVQEAPSDEVSTAVQSITKTETEAAIENITDLPPSSPDVIHELMKIATASKDTVTEGSGDSQQSRPGKRAYKREFKVQCRFCQVKVKDYGYLFRHVKKLHRDKGIEMKQHLEEIRPLMRTPCPICHKMVSSISNISSHIKQCHATKDSAVLCPICKKTYKTTVSLRQHLRQCHQTQQHRFFCHLCSANFTEKRSLKEHINCSHETTQVFQCDDCGKSFLTKGRLRRHRYIHGDFRHKCSYCGKGFHLKDNMNKHIEIVHEKSQGKRFVCPHCDKKFTVKGNMTQHVMGVHLKQFQYTCPQCQTGFRRKKDMLSHMVKHGDSSLPNNQTPTDMSEEDSSNNELDDKSIDSPWHGRGEKTEVITGLADGSSSADGSVPNKTKVIIISPLADYSSS